MSSSTDTAGTDATGHNDGEITIHIDRKPYRVPAGSMTGAQLRTLPNPPIGADRDLYEVVPGPGEDELIADTTVVELREGMHFYSAPTTINPGRGASS